MKYQGMTALQAFYFLTVTLFTVGYGYFVPQSEELRLFMIFYIIIGVTLVLYIANEFAKTVLVSAQDEIILQYFTLRGQSNMTDKDIHHGRVCLSIIAVIFLFVSGTSFYCGNEGWTIIDGMYWTTCTMTTVGYGKHFHDVIKSKYNETFSLDR